MATTIKLKNSVTTTSVPTSLVQGEVAINITDKKVWVGNAATTPIQIAGAGTTGNAAGSNTQVQYNSSGSFAGDADFTFNGTTVTMANDASISGLTVGKGGGAQSQNTAFGSSALITNLTGNGNTANGFQSLYYNTANNNTAYGWQSNFNNTSGTANVSVGYAALNQNTTGGNNTAVGYQAGYANTAFDNTFVGYQSGTTNTTGTNNAAIGLFSLLSNTTGSQNTGLGRNALRNNTTASNNTAVGYDAGFTNTTGTFNTFIGQAAGYNSNGSGNSANTCIGSYAGYNLSTGTGNTFIGSGTTYQSGTAITTGSNNTILGAYNGNLGGLDIRTSNNNIILSDGDGNIRLWVTGGGEALFGGITDNGAYNLQCNGTGVWGAGAYVNGSDERIKDNIQPLNSGLDVVKKLNPVTYKYKETWSKDQSTQTGFIAQELLTALNGEVYVDGVVQQGGQEGYYSVAYQNIIPILVKAVQELTAEIDSLKAQLNK